MMYLALIRNHEVHSVAIGDAAFGEHVRGDFDYVIDVTNRDRPSIGDAYYPETDEFVKNHDVVSDMDVDLEAGHLNRGTEDGFEPFRISKYSVSYADGLVKIGCKSYSALGLLDALHRVLVDKEKVVHCFRVGDTPGHGKFPITWADAQTLYDNLIKVKLT